jgi:hypothetical protein
VNLDDDSIWLDALAGRVETAPFAADADHPGSEAEQSRAPVREGAALRELIRSQPFDAVSDVPGVDAGREAALIERARREGLLAFPAMQPPRTDSAAPRRRGFRVSRLGFAAAAILVVAIGAGFWRSLLPPTETLRGVEHGTVRLTAGDPRALKHQLTEELQAAGATVSGFERLGRAGIDADLPQPLSPQLVRVLERHHIPIPSDGVLIVEIEPPGRE